MSTRVVDVSSLPTTVMGHRDPVWWAVTLLLAIEGTAFALAIAAYFYLRLRYQSWPPAGTLPPDQFWGTLNLVLLLLISYPMYMAEKKARELNVKPVQFWMVLATVLMIPSLWLRYMEFSRLNTKWDDHSYGSAVWWILGLHTIHIVTTFLEDGLFTWYIFRRPLDPKHAFDLSLNSYYYYFVAVSFVFVYAVIYHAPRLIR